MRIGIAASVGSTLDAFFVEIVREWEDHGHQVFAIAGTASKSLPSHVEPGISRRPRLRNASATARIREWSRQNDLDVVVTNTATASALVRLSNVHCPVVYFCHGLHWNRRSVANLPVRLIEKLLLSRTDAVVTINSDDAEWFSSHSSRLPILRLDAGVGLDLSAFPVAGPSDGGLSLLWIGEFSERKRPMDAMRLARHLKDGGAEFQLTMLGDGPLLSSVLEERAKLGLDDDVRCPGRRAVQPYMSACSSVVHTARWEGLPRVLLEATAMGRPVVAYDVKGVRDIRGARLVEDGNVVEFARAVTTVVDRGDTALADYRADLSSRAAAQKLEDFFRLVTGDVQ